MKRNLGNIVFISLAALTVIVWVLFPPQADGVENYVRYHVGMTLGSLVITLMSFSLFLSTRPRWAEPYFGGLDKMYMTHRYTSTAAFLLMFVHLLIVPLHLVDLAVGNYLAIVSFLGIIAIVLPTLAPRVPFLNKLTSGTYEGWKRLHGFIGLFFILGYLHSITVNAPTTKVAINWNQIFVFLGIGSYVYTEVLSRFLGRRVPYTVAAVNHPNSSTTEVVMRAKGRPIRHAQAGQFLFVRFKADGIMDEAHPFTISSAPHEGELRVTIKAVGDFTRQVFQNLKPGADALVEGAYGLFNYKTGGDRQIWVAGGIGITPFLSFLRDLRTELAFDVHFYYTVRHPEEAVFAEEIEGIAAKHPRLKAHIRHSSTHGSLSVDEIVRNAGGNVNAHHVYMCGPLPMVQAFAQKFVEAGVSKDHVHFEEFNFR
ncbi:MAG: ferric reductase-like transmembrane domain-containing protein [Anaerolineales bacterium]|nr:ferric reductase-like transmembrane domain-containing protein [Anaerolineales bacterium]